MRKSRNVNRSIPDAGRNPKRAESKYKRGFGEKKIEEMSADRLSGLEGENRKMTMKGIKDEWSQGRDPLFKVKGMERHRKMKAYR